MDKEWQTVNIPLDSVIDSNMTDMLRNINDPAFIFNRQVLQGGYLPTSIRFEKNGWFCGIYGYDYDINSPDALHDSLSIMPDMQVEKRHTYVSTAYVIQSDNDNGDAVNFVYYPLTKVLAYASKTEPKAEWYQDEHGNLTLVHVSGKTHDFGTDYEFYIDMSDALDGSGDPKIGNAAAWIGVDPVDIDFDGDGNPDLQNVISFDQRRYVYTYTVYDKDASFVDNFLLNYGLSFYIGTEEHEMQMEGNKITYGDNNIITLEFNNYPSGASVEVTSSDINIATACTCMNSKNQVCAVEVSGNIDINVSDNLTTITDKYYMDIDLCHCLCINNSTIGKNTTATVLQNGESCQVPLVAAGYICLSTTCPYESCNVTKTCNNTYAECLYGAVPVWSAQTIYLLRFFGDDIFWPGENAAESGIVATIVPQQIINGANNTCCIAPEVVCQLDPNCKTYCQYYCTVYGNCIYDYCDAISKEHELNSGNCWYIGSVNQCTACGNYSQCVNICIPLFYEPTQQSVNTNVCILLDTMCNNMQVQTVGCVIKMTSDATGFSTGQFDKSCPFAPIPGSIPQFIVHPAFCIDCVHNDPWSRCLIDCILSNINVSSTATCCSNSVAQSLLQYSCKLYTYWHDNNCFYANMQITPITVLYPVAGWFSSYVKFKGLQNNSCVDRACLDNPDESMFDIDSLYCFTGTTQTCRLEPVCSYTTSISQITECCNFSLGGKIVICASNGQAGEDGCSSCWVRQCNSDCVTLYIGKSGKGGDSGTGFEVYYCYPYIDEHGCKCVCTDNVFAPGGAGGAGGSAGIFVAKPVTCTEPDCLSQYSCTWTQGNTPIDYFSLCGISEGSKGGEGGLGSCIVIDLPPSGCAFCCCDKCALSEITLKIDARINCGCAGCPAVTCSTTACWLCNTCRYCISPGFCPDVPYYGGNGGDASACSNIGTYHKGCDAEAKCVNFFDETGTLTRTMSLEEAATDIGNAWNKTIDYRTATSGCGTNLSNVPEANIPYAQVSVYRWACCTDVNYDMVNLQNQNNCFGIHLCCNCIRLSNFLLCCCPDKNTEVRAVELVPYLSDGYIYITSTADAIPAWATSLALTCKDFWCKGITDNLIPDYYGTFTDTTCLGSLSDFECGVCLVMQSSRGCNGCSTLCGGSSGYSIRVTGKYYNSVCCGLCPIDLDIIVPGGAGGAAGGIGGCGCSYQDGPYWYVCGYGSNGYASSGTNGSYVICDLTGCCVTDLAFTFECADPNGINGATSPFYCEGLGPDNSACNGSAGTNGVCTCGTAGGIGGKSFSVGTPSSCVDCFVKLYTMHCLSGAEPWSISSETAQATKLGNTCGLDPHIYLPLTLTSIDRLIDVSATTNHDSYHDLQVLDGVCARETCVSFIDNQNCIQTSAACWTRDNGICNGKYITPCVQVLHGACYGYCDFDYGLYYDIEKSCLRPQLYNCDNCPISSINKRNYSEDKMALGNFSSFNCAVAGYTTNCQCTTFDISIENYTTTTEPYMHITLKGDYKFCTLLPIPNIINTRDSDCNIRDAYIKSYTKNVYNICYNDSDTITFNSKQHNAESMIYNVCACCICNTEQNITGCATLCVCGADFDYATFTLCGIYKNKGTECLSLHAIDSNNLTLQYADNTCFTQIKIDDILNNDTFIDITATNINDSVSSKDGKDNTNETKIASIELNSEYQIIKQQWDSTIETETMWWIDNNHVLLLTHDYFILKEKAFDTETGDAILDDWNGDQWNIKQKFLRTDFVNSTTTKFGVSNVYGQTAQDNGGAILWTFSVIDTAHFKLTCYIPSLNMTKAFSTIFEIEELNYGQKLSTAPNKISVYTSLDAQALISQAEVTATHVGLHFMIGIHLDSALRQWTFIYKRESWQLVRKITGYGYVGVNGSLTGGQFPSQHVNAEYGFFGSVNFINDLNNYHNASVDGNFSMTGIYGTQEQQWYLYKTIDKICSHMQFVESSDVKNHGASIPLVCKWLPIKSTYSAMYSSPSFILNRLTGFMPEPTTIGSIFDFGNNSINTLINVLTAIASPSIWFLNICWIKFGFLNQAIGQYAYTYKTTDKSISADVATIEAFKQANDEQSTNDNMSAFKQNANILARDMLSFDKQEFTQTCTTKSTSNEGISDFWLCLLQAGISGLNVASIATKPQADSILNRNTPGDFGRIFSQFAIENALDSARADLGVSKSNDIVLASKVTAVKTLDMFYSTSSQSMMYAGPGYVCHNFIGYCVAQSMSNRFLSGSQSSMFTALTVLSNLSFMIKVTILKCVSYLFEKLAASVKGSGTYIMGSGTTWGDIAASAMRAAAFVSDQLIATNEFFIQNMPELIRAICPNYPNAQFSSPGNISSHDIDIEAKHNYGSKHVTFMWPCFGCESTYFTKETVAAVLKDMPVKIDFTPQSNSIIANTKGKINLYVSGIDNVTSDSNNQFKQTLYDDVHSHYIYAKGWSEVDNVPPDTAVVEGTTTFLPTVPFKNENIDVTMTFPTAPIQDYMIDDQWSLGFTANQGGILWVSVKDTKLIDGSWSNIVITDDTALVASPYTAIELKKQIERDYIRPVAVTPNALAWNMTGLNVSYDSKMYHGFDGYGYRLVHWEGSSGMAMEDLTLEYCFTENDHFKRSNILMPNHFFGNFTSLPAISLDTDTRDNLYHQFEIDTKGIGIENITSAENKHLTRYAMPIFTEQLSTMPSVIKTLSSYRLNVIQGVTSLTSDLRLTQNTYKIPKSIDFNINKTLYRATEEYVNALNESGLSVGDLTSKLGLEFIGATPTQAFFYSEATRAYYSFTGAAMIQKQDVWNRFKDIKDGKWDFVNQNVVFQCIGNMTRVMDNVVDTDNDLIDNIFIATMDGQKSGITGEITPPNTAIFDNKSWFKTYSFAGGFAYQGPNRYIVNRFICLDYMIDDIVNNKGKWTRVDRDTFNPYRKYNETFKSVNDRVGDSNDYTYTKATTFDENTTYYYISDKQWKRAYGLTEAQFNQGSYYTRKLTPVVEGWTHNPFLLATAPLGLSENIDCLYEWTLTFTWTDEMDMLYGNKDYACVNIMAQTMCPGGKKRTEPTHLYLYKELFTRSDNSGYYSFKFTSRNGAGNREQLFIWSDAYIAMTGLAVSYKIVTDNRTTPLATSQVDIQEMSEF